MDKITHRILIIDDDEINSLALAKRLDRRDFSCVNLHSGHKALETLVKEKIELILLDVVMPEIDGISLLKDIRKQYSKNDLPIIMVTAIDEVSDVVKAFEAGANDYITKPVNIEAAVARMSAHLGLLDLHRESLRKKELEAINAMIITYNHEINNPLSIAMGALKLLEKKCPSADKDYLEKINEAHCRIRDIVAKIRDLDSNSKISFDTYGNVTKMVSINKK